MIKISAVLEISFIFIKPYDFNFIFELIFDKWSHW